MRIEMMMMMMITSYSYMGWMIFHLCNLNCGYEALTGPPNIELLLIMILMGLIQFRDQQPNEVQNLLINGCPQTEVNDNLAPLGAMLRQHV